MLFPNAMPERMAEHWTQMMRKEFKRLFHALGIAPTP